MYVGDVATIDNVEPSLMCLAKVKLLAYRHENWKPFEPF